MASSLPNDACNMVDNSVDVEQIGKIPILLLKTKSTPNDGYEEYFLERRSKNGKWDFESTFVPVLEHRFRENGVTAVKSLAMNRQVSNEPTARYGGLIFTSQRAVEAFAEIVEDGRRNMSDIDRHTWPHLQSVPIYTVGPATSRALKSIPQDPPLNVFGSETGSGEALAYHILDHYHNWYTDHPSKPPILFLVGEQRRDVIPKTLTDPTLPLDRQIPVDELVVYDTAVMETFERDFSRVLKDMEDIEVKWIVVFSPTGCEAMLRALDILNADTGRVKTGERGGGCGNRKGKGRRSTYVAAIGPTTRDYLRKTFGFEPDVCARKPSPEGIGEAIDSFMEKYYS